MKEMTKCPNCGGNLKYNIQKRNIWCEHCGSSFPISAPTKKVKLVHQYTLDYSPELQEDNINQYYCNSCKSTHVVDGGKISTRCPNCASVDIIQTNSNTACPDGIIPFEITKEKAARIFEDWLKHRAFAPHDLHLLARNEKLSPVYVPVFNVNATCICNYMATVKKVHVDNNTDTMFVIFINLQSKIGHFLQILLLIKI